jgi:tripartite-type tricarboxylate transporter receptor subunit TctC
VAIVRKINSDVRDVLQTQEMVDFLATQGAEPFITTPDGFAAILKSDVAMWAKVVKAANVKLN